MLAQKVKINLWLVSEQSVNRTTVSNWCANEVQKTMESLFRISNALNVDVRELLVSAKKT